jgi:phage terminase small subunit
MAKNPKNSNPDEPKPPKVVPPIPRGRPKGAKDLKPRKRYAKSATSYAKKRADLVPDWQNAPGGPLNPKQALFVSEYLVDHNGTRAARAAGYSPKSAHIVASGMLKLPKVKDAIARAVEAQMTRTTITADLVLAELALVAFSKPTAIMSWGPNGVILKDSETMRPEDIALVAEVSETKGTDKGGGSMKVKLHDKMKALELLGRHLGIFVEVQKVQVQDVGKATSDQKEEFALLAARAQQRWASQGFVCGSTK